MRWELPQASTWVWFVKGHYDCCAPLHSQYQVVVQDRRSAELAKHVPERAAVSHSTTHRYSQMLFICTFVAINTTAISSDICLHLQLNNAKGNKQAMLRVQIYTVVMMVLSNKPGLPLHISPPTDLANPLPQLAIKVQTPEPKAKPQNWQQYSQFNHGMHRRTDE